MNGWIPATDLSEQAAQLKKLPSAALFRDFCATLEAKLPHRWLSGTATSVCKDSSTGKFRVHCKATATQREVRVVARAVILATGPVGEWNVPPPFAAHLASGLVLHTEELLCQSAGTLSEQIARRCPDRLRFEFLCLPMQGRRKAVRDAAAGGSVPARYMEELRRYSQTSSSLRLEVDQDIDGSHVRIDEDSQHVLVNGEAFAIVILATGVVTAPSCSPLYRSIEERLAAPTVEGLPRVDSRLRWVAGEDLFVLGANAMLELGPGGGNLMGAMKGGRVVSNELHALMNKAKPCDGRRPIFSNMYAAIGDRLRFGDGSEAEIDVLAQQLNLSPQAETALRKARKNRKDTKGLKGERDPLAYLRAHERRAAYW